MQYKEQIDLSRIPQHVAIIMDGNDGRSSVDTNAATDIRSVQKPFM